MERLVTSSSDGTRLCVSRLVVKPNGRYARQWDRQIERYPLEVDRFEMRCCWRERGNSGEWT